MTMRNVWKCALGLLAGLGVLAGNAGAQFKNGSQATELNIPRVSQRGTVSQRIGLTDITITYHRPEVGGREIWGKTVPYGKVWRAGANENTTITFSDDVSVEGKPLAAGTYGLHTVPDKDQWTIIFSKNSTSWGSFSYDEKEDALRVNTKPQATDFREALTYTFEEVKPDSAAATLRWEKLAVPVHISVDVKAVVLRSIKNELRSENPPKCFPRALIKPARFNCTRTPAACSARGTPSARLSCFPKCQRRMRITGLATWRSHESRRTRVISRTPPRK